MKKLQIKYRYRLLVYFLILLLFAALVFFIYNARQSRGYSISNLLTELKNANTDLYSQMTKGTDYKQVTLPDQINFTLLDSSGFVIYDSKQHQETYKENQSDESEIINARRFGEGSALRPGIIDTDDEYLYLAEKYFPKSTSLLGQYGDSVYLRTSTKFRTEKPAQIEKNNAYMLLIAVLLALLIIASFVISSILSKPLRTYGKLVEAIKSNRKDLSHIRFSNDDFGRVGKDIADTFQQLEKTKQYKQQMSQNIAHELKTPVTGIKAYLETIIENPEMDARQVRKFVDKAYNQTIRLSHLVSEVSTLNKLDETAALREEAAGQGADNAIQEGLYPIETVNIKECLKEVLEEIGYKLEASNITFKSLVSSKLKLQGCHSLIYSLFKNLIDNTIEHGGAGCHITLSAGIDQPSGDGGYKINFRYTDTGKGVPEEAINRIFERFYRVESGRTRKTGGSGLGLAIVKNAVTFHKGTISAHNLPEGGILFKFSLYSL